MCYYSFFLFLLPKPPKLKVWIFLSNSNYNVFIIFTSINQIKHDYQITNPKGWWDYPLSKLSQTITIRKRLTLFNTGGFAECFLVQRMEDKKSYALKIIPKKLLTRSKARQKVYKYLYILDALRDKITPSSKTQKYLWFIASFWRWR